MGSHNAGEIPSAAAEAQAVPGAGCSCENPTDVAWCLTLGGRVAICSTVNGVSDCLQIFSRTPKMLQIGEGKGS